MAVSALYALSKSDSMDLLSIGLLTVPTTFVALFAAKLYTIPRQERCEISGTQAGRQC
jgi:hypothetical protein